MGGIHSIDGRWLRWMRGRDINGNMKRREGGDPCSLFSHWRILCWEGGREGNVEKEKGQNGEKNESQTWIYWRFFVLTWTHYNWLDLGSKGVVGKTQHLPILDLFTSNNGDPFH